MPSVSEYCVLKRGYFRASFLAFFRYAGAYSITHFIKDSLYRVIHRFIADRRFCFSAFRTRSTKALRFFCFSMRYYEVPRLLKRGLSQHREHFPDLVDFACRCFHSSIITQKAVSHHMGRSPQIFEGDNPQGRMTYAIFFRYSVRAIPMWLSWLIIIFNCCHKIPLNPPLPRPRRVSAHRRVRRGEEETTGDYLPFTNGYFFVHFFIDKNSQVSVIFPTLSYGGISDDAGYNSC